MAFIRFVIVCVPLVVCSVAAAQPPSGERPIIVAERIAADERIVLDGALEEPVWQRAIPIDGFRQQEPGEGSPPSERTEIRVAFSRDALYIAATMFDSDPSGIKGYQKRRDAGLGSDDRFMWILDTFLDGRSAYFFEINPAGLMGDGLLRLGSGNNMSKSWDGIWHARVRRHDEGWTAEIELPFRTFNFDPSAAEWGINFQRTIRRKNEELLWSGWRRTEGLFRPATAGRLRGLDGLSQGLGLEVRPYTSGSFRDVGGHQVVVGDVGADIGYSLTPGIRAALTINTDFAETDVDDRQVNLTRFPLFFPERRQFFLEGSSLYNFAGANGVNPFFSRRIGLAAGEPVPIVYGSRIGGQVGAFEMGAMHIRTGARGATPAETFTVARVKRGFFSQSSIGAIYTRRATDVARDVALDDRHTIGVDLDLYTSEFLGNKNLQFEAFVVSHTDPSSSGALLRDRSAHGIRVNYPNDVWQAHVSYRELGDEFNPAVGFTPRNGFRRWQPQVTWFPRPGWWRAVRQLEFQARLEHLTNLDGVLETRSIGFTPIGARFESGDNFGLNLINNYERLVDPFDIAAGVRLPAGEYQFNTVQFDVRTATRRPVSVNFEVESGEFWSGDSTAWELGVELRPAATMSFRSDLEYRTVSLPEGAFATTLTRFSANFYPTPWTSVTTRTQYDDVSGVLGLYARLRWIMQPGSDLFLVYSHDWNDTDGRFRTRTRGATTKVNYTYRF